MSDELPEAPPPPSFPPDAAMCGHCKLWSAVEHGPRGWVGPCRVQPQRGLFPGTAPICDAYAPRGQKAAATSASAEAPRRRAMGQVGPVVRRAGQVANVTGQSPIRREDHHVELDPLGDQMTKAELMEVFLEATGLADVPLAPKWEGGTVKLQPKSAELQAKELPIDSLFHKVVMIRDRLRTLEQKLNAHPKLTDGEKVELQQYVTRCYGSLTTFNVLFREKSDQFTGQKGDE